MTPDMSEHPEQTVVRVEHATQGTRGRKTHLVEIVRPSAELMAHDPSVIAGFESLGRRVILQAFEDAAHGDAQARAFLTAHEDDGLLSHWVQQAGITLSLPAFIEGATTCLGNPERVQTLFARYRPRPVSSPTTTTPTLEEDSPHE